jgi:hypothetical protein
VEPWSPEKRKGGAWTLDPVLKDFLFGELSYSKRHVNGLKGEEGKGVQAKPGLFVFQLCFRISKAI